MRQIALYKRGYNGFEERLDLALLDYKTPNKGMPIWMNSLLQLIAELKPDDHVKITVEPMKEVVLRSMPPP